MYRDGDNPAALARLRTEMPRPGPGASAQSQSRSRIGTVGVRQFFGGYRVRPGAEFAGKPGPAAGHQCHLDLFCLVNSPSFLDAGNRFAFAAR